MDLERHYILFIDTGDILRRRRSRKHLLGGDFVEQQSGHGEDGELRGGKKSFVRDCGIITELWSKKRQNYHLCSFLAC